MCLKNALVKVKVLFQLLYSSKAKKKKKEKRVGLLTTL